MTNYRALKRFKKVSFYVGLVLILVVLLFPLYWAFQSSITSTRLILSKNPPLLPVSFDFSAYKEVMTRKPIFLWLKNTMFVALTSTVFGVALSLLAGYSLSRFKTMGNKLMGFFLLLSRMLPATLLVIPIYMMFSKVKMINSLWALIMMNLVNIIPFSTWMMKGYFDSMDI